MLWVGFDFRCVGDCVVTHVDHHLCHIHIIHLWVKRYVSGRISVCVCVCVCKREREKETERVTVREIKIEREGGRTGRTRNTRILPHSLVGERGLKPHLLTGRIDSSQPATAVLSPSVPEAPA